MQVDFYDDLILLYDQGGDVVASEVVADPQAAWITLAAWFITYRTKINVEQAWREFGNWAFE